MSGTSPKGNEMSISICAYSIIKLVWDCACEDEELISGKLSLKRGPICIYAFVEPGLSAFAKTRCGPVA